MGRAGMKKRRDPTAWVNAILNSKPMPEGDATAIANRVRIAFERLKSGAGATEDYDRLGAAINVGIVRGEQIAPEVVDVMLAAGDAVLECCTFHDKHGRFGFTGPGMLAINEALDVYEQLLKLSSRHQLSQAVDESHRRILRQIAERSASNDQTNRRQA